MSGHQGARILVIKLSALGDFVMSLGAFQAIRAHHPQAEIVLLTTQPHAALGEASGCFQDIWLDRRPGPLDVSGWLALARRIRRAGFARIYDLQRSQRSGWYFRLLGRPRPEWVGVVRGCSHRYRPPAGGNLHILDRQAAQLALVGIAAVPPPELSFIRADVGRFALPQEVALLVPGGAHHRAVKRWPPQSYAALARALAARGVTPVLLGTAVEAAALAEIAATGCPVVSLFSSGSNPAKVAPRGHSVTVLRRARLADLLLEEVLVALPPALSNRTAMAKSNIQGH
jgi:ADP-heptose:LPS heptosyltransferase